MRRPRRQGFLSLAAPALVLSLALTPPLAADGPTIGPEIHITRATSAIEVDGDLSDPAWKDAKPVDVWFDTNGNEDSSPDFFWDSAARITPTGWTLEMRVPFSSLRYPKGDPQTWGIILYRNWPRDFRYQFFAQKLPRNENCFICHGSPLTG